MPVSLRKLVFLHQIRAAVNSIYMGTVYTAYILKRLCTSKKECNKLDLTAGQYFSLVDHTDWSRWFATGISHVYVVPVTVLSVGLPKKKKQHNF
jgi:hypothetical protein